MCHAPGELANGLHLLGLPQLLLELRARTTRTDVPQLSLDRGNESRQASFDQEIVGSRLQRRDGGFLSDGS